jgi:hypothetical protein
LAVAAAQGGILAAAVAQAGIGHYLHLSPPGHIQQLLEPAGLAAATQLELRQAEALPLSQGLSLLVEEEVQTDPELINMEERKVAVLVAELEAGRLPLEPRLESEILQAPHLRRVILEV